MQEPLCEDGTISPDSALSPPIGASEASDDSPSAVGRVQQQVQQQVAAAAGAAGAVVAGAATAAAGAAAAAAAVAGVPPAAAAVSSGEEPEAVVPLALREASVRQSLTSVYYDASDMLLDDVSSDGTAAAAAAGQRAELPPPWQAAAPAALAEDEALASPQPLPERSPLTASALAASSLSRRALHRRTVSTDSAASGAETPLGEDGQPLPKQPASRRFWRRFNRDYGEWETYWDEGQLWWACWVLCVLSGQLPAVGWCGTIVAPSARLAHCLLAHSPLQPLLFPLPCRSGCGAGGAAGPAGDGGCGGAGAAVAGGAHARHVLQHLHPGECSPPSTCRAASRIAALPPHCRRQHELQGLFCHVCLSISIGNAFSAVDCADQLAMPSSCDCDTALPPCCPPPHPCRWPSSSCVSAGAAVISRGGHLEAGAVPGRCDVC